MMSLHLKRPSYHCVVVTPGTPSFTRETGSMLLIAYPTCIVPAAHDMVSSEKPPMIQVSLDQWTWDSICLF